MFKKLCLTAAMVAAAATSFAGDLVINGSTTVLPVVQKATEAFAKTNPDVQSPFRVAAPATASRR